ncbi:hypothetical protein Cfor_11978 [Coptotermes formosanus]|uniref:Odorant receptor n=1 Tax=Coptotermes formosanus TaxID=36987 RepID=A0A6L2PE44_COPFO|nr:hypothetical protein Cfor_04251 [Coptotermes formosanus]GFG32337.1 hypothetical protein Cfor_11978 [Coptotermes formosanus]
MFHAAYETNWYENSSQIKQLTRIMIMRVSKPVEAKAGLMGTIDLPLFASIMRTAYSYLTLLKQMQEDAEST